MYSMYMYICMLKNDIKLKLGSEGACAYCKTATLLCGS